MRLAAIVSGVVALALLMAQVNTPFVGAAALLAPLAGGAWAAVRRTREAGHELSVDESAGLGARVGLIGGFIVAVPFPLAMHMYVARQAEARAMGLALTIGTAAVVLIVFFVLAVVGAVIGGRVRGGRL